MQETRIKYNDIDLGSSLPTKHCPKGHPMDWFWSNCPICREEKNKEKKEK